MPKYGGKQKLWEYPPSGSKAISVEEEERAKVGNNNGQYICLNQKNVTSQLYIAR